MRLCKYRNIFGAPRTGAHAYRLLGIAVVDLVATVVVAILFSTYVSVKTASARPFRKWTIYFTLSFLTLIIMAIILHRIFCVNTTVNMAIFGTVPCHG